MRALCVSFMLAALFVGAGVFGFLAHSAERPSQSARPALSALVGEFEALQADSARSGLRDSWLTLEKKFAALEESGVDAAGAAFYRARSRQELGRRSFSSADHREAVKRFAKVAATYPDSPFAAESLFRQGGILYRLGDKKSSIPVLEKVLRSYPASPFAAEVKSMLADAGRASGGTAAVRQKAAEAGEAAPQPEATNREASAERGTKATPAKGASPTVVLKNITWEKKGQRALVTLELNNTAQVEHNFLPPDAERKTPGRVYLDIADAFPREGLKPGKPPKGLVVSGIRAGKTEGGTRVTLECDGIQCYVVRSPKGSPQIIQIEVSRKEDLKDGIVVSRADEPVRQASQPARKGRGSASVMEQLGLTVKTIMLDAGHGGHDPGAQGAGITEKDFTLSMAKRVASLLKKEGFTVLYTRSGDSFISLQDRPDIANEKNADLFISIHVNANPKNTIHGLETYYLSEAKSKDAATVAARENGVSVKNISDLQFILTDLMLSTKLKESRHLARCVHKGILQRLKNGKLPADDNGVRSAPFYVLMGARMPAILVEFGYITNDKDVANLKNETFLQRQAEGLVSGIVQYRAELANMVK